MDDVFAVADRFFAAIEAGDMEAVAALYAPDVRVWHNTDNREQDKDASLATLAWVCAHSIKRHYDVTRRAAIPGGFMQQHVMHMTLGDGREVAMPAALSVEVTDGQVSRIEEYLDSAQTAELASAPKVA